MHGRTNEIGLYVSIEVSLLSCVTDILVIVLSWSDTL